MDQQDIDNRFTHHPPKDDKTVYAYKDIREKAKELTELINETVPDGREKSLAVTKAEESVFWANAGIARASA